jgi:carboxypeptidase family protein
VSGLCVDFKRATLWLVLAAGVVLSLPQGAVVVEAQNLGQRSVSGSVVDDRSSPVGGATVFLKNQKTKGIRSYTSAADGRFRFAQVNMSDDFDLWAEKDSRKTAVKTVSSWDARKEFETELKFK